MVDGFAGWDEQYRINVRVVCARAYHALFMRNMLIRPSREELEHFKPDYTIYNAGSFPANRFTTGMTSATSVAINFAEKEMVILGTEYAGEMKKGIFTVLFYEMPVKHNVLTLHSSANEGKGGDVTVFFGLSGTGKTTLSADPNRALIVCAFPSISFPFCTVFLSLDRAPRAIEGFKLPRHVSAL